MTIQQRRQDSAPRQHHAAILSQAVLDLSTLFDRRLLTRNPLSQPDDGPSHPQLPGHRTGPRDAVGICGSPTTREEENTKNKGKIKFRLPALWDKGKKKTRFLTDMGPLASLHSPTHGAVPRGRGPHNVSHLPTPSILCGCTIPAYLEVRRRKRRLVLQRNKGPVASREGYLGRFMCVHIHGGTPSPFSRLAQRLDCMLY